MFPKVPGSRCACPGQEPRQRLHGSRPCPPWTLLSSAHCQPHSRNCCCRQRCPPWLGRTTRTRSGPAQDRGAVYSPAPGPGSPLPDPGAQSTLVAGITYCDMGGSSRGGVSFHGLGMIDFCWFEGRDRERGRDRVRKSSPLHGLPQTPAVLGGEHPSGLATAAPSVCPTVGTSLGLLPRVGPAGRWSSRLSVAGLPVGFPEQVSRFPTVAMRRGPLPTPAPALCTPVRLPCVAESPSRFSSPSASLCSSS